MGQIVGKLVSIRHKQTGEVKRYPKPIATLIVKGSVKDESEWVFVSKGVYKKYDKEVSTPHYSSIGVGNSSIGRKRMQKLSKSPSSNNRKETKGRKFIYQLFNKSVTIKEDKGFYLHKAKVFYKTDPATGVVTKVKSGKAEVIRFIPTLKSTSVIEVSRFGFKRKIESFQ